MVAVHHAEIVSRLPAGMGEKYLKKLSPESVKEIDLLVKGMGMHHPSLVAIANESTIPKKRHAIVNAYKLHGSGFLDWVKSAGRTVASTLAPLGDVAKEAASKLVVNQAKKLLDKY